MVGIAQEDVGFNKNVIGVIFIDDDDRGLRKGKEVRLGQSNAKECNLRHLMRVSRSKCAIGSNDK